jgi:hypothetical protein
VVKPPPPRSPVVVPPRTVPPTTSPSPLRSREEEEDDAYFARFGLDKNKKPSTVVKPPPPRSPVVVEEEEQPPAASSSSSREPPLMIYREKIPTALLQKFVEGWQKEQDSSSAVVGAGVIYVASENEDYGPLIRLMQDPTFHERTRASLGPKEGESLDELLCQCLGNLHSTYPTKRREAKDAVREALNRLEMRTAAEEEVMALLE